MTKPNIGDNLPFTTKYRCTEYDEIIGNEDCVSELKVYHKKNIFPPLIIMYGYYGTGKTTCSNIAIRTILCKNPKPNGESCGICSSCRAINKDLFLKEEESFGVNYKLVDLGHHADDEEYLNQVVSTLKSSIYSQRKGPLVVKIEEMQKVSEENQAKFNKIFENLPPNVHVIINTNNISNISASILGRARHVFYFSTPTEIELINYITKICNLEKIKLTKIQKIKLIEYTNRNTRKILQELNHIKDTDGLSIDNLIKEQYQFTSYVDYLKASKLGISALLDFMASIDSKVKFMMNFNEFLKIVFQIKNNKTVDVPKDIKNAIAVETQPFSQALLARLLGSVAPLRFNKGMTNGIAEDYMIAIAMELNTSLTVNMLASDKQKAAILRSEADGNLSQSQTANEDISKSDLEGLMEHMYDDDFGEDLEHKEGEHEDEKSEEYVSPFSQAVYLQNDAKDKKDATLIQSVDEVASDIKQPIQSVDDL